jgi:hypothetical protein
MLHLLIIPPTYVGLAVKSGGFLDVRFSQKPLQVERGGLHPPQLTGRRSCLSGLCRNLHRSAAAQISPTLEILIGAYVRARI